MEHRNLSKYQLSKRIVLAKKQHTPISDHSHSYGHGHGHGHDHDYEFAIFLECFAQRLLYLRERFGFTQKELAIGLKSTQAQISVLENGGPNLKFSTLFKISRFFKIDPYILIADIESIAKLTKYYTPSHTAFNNKRFNL